MEIPFTNQSYYDGRSLHHFSSTVCRLLDLSPACASIARALLPCSGLPEPLQAELAKMADDMQRMKVGEEEDITGLSYKQRKAKVL